MTVQPGAQPTFYEQIGGHETFVRLVDAFPRYLPTWSRPLLSVPGVREVATWNLVLVLAPAR